MGTDASLGREEVEFVSVDALEPKVSGTFHFDTTCHLWSRFRNCVGDTCGGVVDKRACLVYPRLEAWPT